MRGLCYFCHSGWASLSSHMLISFLTSLDCTVSRRNSHRELRHIVRIFLDNFLPVLSFSSSFTHGQLRSEITKAAESILHLCLAMATTKSDSKPEV